MLLVVAQMKLREQARVWYDTFTILHRPCLSFNHDLCDVFKIPNYEAATLKKLANKKQGIKENEIDYILSMN